MILKAPWPPLLARGVLNVSSMRGKHTDSWVIVICACSSEGRPRTRKYPKRGCAPYTWHVTKIQLHDKAWHKLTNILCSFLNTISSIVGLRAHSPGCSVRNQSSDGHTDGISRTRHFATYNAWPCTETTVKKEGAPMATRSQEGPFIYGPRCILAEVVYVALGINNY